MSESNETKLQSAIDMWTSSHPRDTCYLDLCPTWMESELSEAFKDAGQDYCHEFVLKWIMYGF